MTFVLLLILAILWMPPRKAMFAMVGIGVVLLTLLTPASVLKGDWAGQGPFVTGIQMEGASEQEVVKALDGALRYLPQTDIFVLGEYTFAEPPPAGVMAWCRNAKRYLVVGGIEPAGDGSERFRDTAFVVGPAGEVVFRQAKAVPIQFMQDGLPAKSQGLWKSPWGAIGVCICYDLSYTRVTDELVRQGAEGLIVPTMDAASWGLHEHLLHARIAPARGAEYGIPIFRVCSSGISELVSGYGRVEWAGQFPGAGEVIAGRLRLQGTGKLPGSCACAAVRGRVVILVVVMIGVTWNRWRQARRENKRVEIAYG